MPPLSIGTAPAQLVQQTSLMVRPAKLLGIIIAVGMACDISPAAHSQYS